MWVCHVVVLFMIITLMQIQVGSVRMFTAWRCQLLLWRYDVFPRSTSYYWRTKCSDAVYCCYRRNITCCPRCIHRRCQPIADSSVVVISPSAMSCLWSRARLPLTGHVCHRSQATCAFDACKTPIDWAHVPQISGSMCIRCMQSQMLQSVCDMINGGTRCLENGRWVKGGKIETLQISRMMWMGPNRTYGERKIWHISSITERIWWEDTLAFSCCSANDNGIGTYTVTAVP